MSFWKSYAWDAKVLARDLKAGEVSESFKRNVFVLWMGILYLSAALSPGSPEGPGRVGVVSALLSFALFFASVRVCHGINARGDNRDFLGRYVALSLPLLVRLIMLTVAVALPFACVGAPFMDPRTGGESFEWFDAGWSVVLEIVQFFWMRNCFRRMHSF